MKTHHTIQKVPKDSKKSDDTFVVTMKIRDFGWKMLVCNRRKKVCESIVEQTKNNLGPKIEEIRWFKLDHTTGDIN